MKKTKMMLAAMATLAVGAMLFTSCNNDPKPEPKPTPNNNGVEAKEIIISREGSSSKLENVDVMEGKTTKIMISVKPATAKINEVKIADESIATFKSNVITGVKKGTTTLTVKAGKNNLEATLKITVTEKKEVKFEYDLLTGVDKLILPKNISDLKDMDPQQFLSIVKDLGWEEPIADGKNLFEEFLPNFYISKVLKGDPKGVSDLLFYTAIYVKQPKEGPMFIIFGGAWTWTPNKPMLEFDKKDGESLVERFETEGKYAESLKQLGFEKNGECQVQKDGLGITQVYTSSKNNNVLFVSYRARKDKDGKPIYTDGKNAVDKTNPEARISFGIEIEVVDKKDIKTAQEVKDFINMRMEAKMTNLLPLFNKSISL